MRIKRIVIHSSDSRFGTALLIDKWHKERGWRMIGYHNVIQNGYPAHNQLLTRRPWEFLDGSVECGRSLDTDSDLDKDEIGAHTFGFNRTSVSVCLILKEGEASPKQLASLKAVCNAYRHCFDLPLSAVRGHYELNTHKTCPGLDMDLLRAYLDEHQSPGAALKKLDLLLGPWNLAKQEGRL